MLQAATALLPLCHFGKAERTTDRRLMVSTVPRSVVVKTQKHTQNLRSAYNNIGMSIGIKELPTEEASPTRATFKVLMVPQYWYLLLPTSSQLIAIYLCIRAIVRTVTTTCFAAAHCLRSSLTFVIRTARDEHRIVNQHVSAILFSISARS